MSDVAAAIVKVLDAHGGWITPGTLRDRLPVGCPRGEPLEFALGQLIRSKRIQTRAAGDQMIYQLAPGGDGAPPAPVPISAPGQDRAVADAFHPPRPNVLFRGQPLNGPDEVKPPNPTTVSHAKPKEINTMKTKAESPKPRILKMLQDGPLRTIQIAKKLDMTDAGASFHLRTLEREGAIAKANRLAPWSLVNGKAGEPVVAAPASSSAGRAVSKKRRVTKRAAPKRAKFARRGGGRTAPARAAVPTALAAATSCVEDLEMKLQVLADQAEHAGKIGGFVLREIRADLQRLGAAVPA